MVQRETIERICLDVADLPDPTLEREFERFFEEQETICDFLMDSLGETSQRARELALYLSYVAYKGMSLDSGLSRAVDRGTILRAGEAARRWLDRIEDYAWTEDRSPATRESAKGASIAPIGDEPHLVGFVAAEIENAAEGDIPLDDEEKGALMFTLKTIVVSMTAKSSGEDPLQ